MKRKLLMLIAVIIFVTSIQPPVFAGDSPITVLVNGAKIRLDVQPYFEKGILMAPIDVIASALKFSVKSLPAENATQLSKGSKVLKIVQDSNILYVNGEKKELESKTVSKSKKTFVSIASLADHIEISVDWIANKRMVLVNSYVKQVRPFGRVRDTNGDLKRDSDGDLVMESSTFQGPKFLLDRLLQTGDYEVIKDGRYTGEYRPKDKKAKFTISTFSWSPCTEDLFIDIYDYDEYTRKKVKELLAICYPKNYETAYMFMIVVMRGEVFELGTDPYIGACMLDNRSVTVCKHEGDTNFKFYVGYYGYDKSDPAENEYTYHVPEARTKYPMSFIDMIVKDYNINEYTIKDYNKVRKLECTEDGHIKRITQFGVVTYERK